MGLLRSLCRGDKVVWIIFFALCVISLLEVFSATSTLTYKTANHWAPFTGHCTHLLIGLGTVLVVHRLPYRWFRYGWTAAFPIFALVLCYLTMSGMLVNGAARWGEVFGTRVQPSEFAKISVIVVVSTLLMLHKNAGFRSKNTFWYILVMVGTMCLLIFRENLSTAVILFGTVFCMMFVGKIPSGQMLKLSGVCLAVAGLFLAVVFLSPEDSDSGVLHRFSVWKDRVIDFVTPIDCDARDYVITDDNRQTSHASIAIASSNVVGCMPGNSVQRDFLAQAYSDFIYAIIIEELGLLGGGLVFVFYLILLIRAGRIARKCDRAFPAFLVMGLAIMLVIQAVVNMAVAVGLFPVTGQTLPLISRGGSSILAVSLCIGMILSVSRSNDERIAAENRAGSKDADGGAATVAELSEENEEQKNDER